MALALKCPIDGLDFNPVAVDVRDLTNARALEVGGHVHITSAVDPTCPNGHAWRLDLLIERTA